MIRDENEILSLMRENKGILSAEELDKLGISIRKLQQMAKDKKVERLVRGLYLHPEFVEDPYYITQYRAPKAIFSNETALYLHSLSDENSVKIVATIPSGYNSSLLKDKGYKFYYLKEELWKLGQVEITSPFGNKIWVYSKERSLAEMMAKVESGDRNLLVNALKAGLEAGILNSLDLIKYAEIFGSKEQMRNYMEVLIWYLKILDN